MAKFLKKKWMDRTKFQPNVEHCILLIIASSNAKVQFFKQKFDFSHYPAIALVSFYSDECKSYIYRNAGTRVFIAAFCIIFRN